MPYVDCKTYSDLRVVDIQKNACLKLVKYGSSTSKHIIVSLKDFKKKSYNLKIEEEKDCLQKMTVDILITIIKSQRQWNMSFKQMGEKQQQQKHQTIWFDSTKSNSHE